MTYNSYLKLEVISKRSEGRRPSVCFVCFVCLTTFLEYSRSVKWVAWTCAAYKPSPVSRRGASSLVRRQLVGRSSLVKRGTLSRADLHTYWRRKRHETRRTVSIWLDDVHAIFWTGRGGEMRHVKCNIVNGTIKTFNEKTIF